MQARFLPEQDVDSEDSKKLEENQSELCMLYYIYVLSVAFSYFLFSVYFPFAKLL